MIKGLTVERAPIHNISISCSKASFTWSLLATSVAVFKPVSSFTRCSHWSPKAPTPSNIPGRVRGFQIPARKKDTSVFLRLCAIFSTCSSVSALQGPAITTGWLSCKSSNHFLFPFVISIVLLGVRCQVSGFRVWFFLSVGHC